MHLLNMVQYDNFTVLKYEYAQFHIGTQSQAKYFQIQLRNDQGRRDIKHHNNVNANICAQTCMNESKYYYGIKVRNARSNMKLQELTIMKIL